MHEIKQFLGWTLLILIGFFTIYHFVFQKFEGTPPLGAEAAKINEIHLMKADQSKPTGNLLNVLGRKPSGESQVDLTQLDAHKMLMGGKTVPPSGRPSAISSASPLNPEKVIHLNGGFNVIYMTTEEYAALHPEEDVSKVSFAMDLTSAYKDEDEVDFSALKGECPSLQTMSSPVALRIDGNGYVIQARLNPLRLLSEQCAAVVPFAPSVLVNDQRRFAWP